MYKKLIFSVCFVLVLGMVITNEAKAEDENLVGWWKFDEGSGDIATDSSGNEFDIPLLDHLWADGVFGGAVHFPGQGQGQRGGFRRKGLFRIDFPQLGRLSILLEGPIRAGFG